MMAYVAAFFTHREKCRLSGICAKAARLKGRAGILVSLMKEESFMTDVLTAGQNVASFRSDRSLNAFFALGRF